eukprot:CAMPEP_0170295640 /NCGR_PEP_ID=MMETSP0116_2-20130129/47946_1 /TAXON_ID=400756 /ORGANISM="Durinskia baltica, Strain CSIRO CS-38" /LENGTH=74 /DNA_ID=CAMNT_0010547195 /DNA_START=153 /DNA_END=374 /DNA_ORIENTATION=-
MRRRFHVAARPLSGMRTSAGLPPQRRPHRDMAGRGARRAFGKSGQCEARDFSIRLEAAGALTERRPGSSPWRPE